MSKKTNKRFVWPWQLHKQGILGINSRNLFLYLNPRHLYPQVDDKSITKQICHNSAIPVPKTYALVERFGDIARLHELLLGKSQFVIKPSQGAGGRGILIMDRTENECYYTSNGRMLTLNNLKQYVSTILSGMYSLGGRPDKAIIEERIQIHPDFKNLAIAGTPDIRIIVYRGHPVMGMLRLPTTESRGKANLHQGAVGVGIDLDSGTTTHGVLRNKPICTHPDTNTLLGNVPLPHWRQILKIAGHLSSLLGMGYVGVDLVVDIATGPVVLEANARPGLSIQIANRCGLLPRIEEIERQLCTRTILQSTAISPHAFANTEFQAVPPNKPLPRQGSN